MTATPSQGRVVERALTIAPDHPAFAGHFPGQPILPGVALLAEVLETWRAAAEGPAASLPPLPATLQWPALKFLAPVRPGARLRITLQCDGRQLRFTVNQDEPGAPGALTVASGSLALPAAAEGA